MKTKKTWILQDAKNRFSELFEQALTQGPQKVTRRGKDAVVIIAADQFEQLGKKKGSLVKFFAESPLASIELPLDRDSDTGREDGIFD
jgi:antitoxin Phd